MQRAGTSEHVDHQHFHQVEGRMRSVVGARAQPPLIVSQTRPHRNWCAWCVSMHFGALWCTVVCLGTLVSRHLEDTHCRRPDCRGPQSRDLSDKSGSQRKPPTARTAPADRWRVVDFRHFPGGALGVILDCTGHPPGVCSRRWLRLQIRPEPLQEVKRRILGGA